MDDPLDSFDSRAPLAPRPMSFAVFRRLWRGGAQRERNWAMTFEDYRDAYLLLLAATLPHMARLAIPRYLQPPLVDFFTQRGEHQFYVEPCRSGERVRLTIWQPHQGE